MLQYIIGVDKNKEMELAVVKIPDIPAKKGSLKEMFKGTITEKVIEEAREADIRKEEILERDKINGGVCSKFSELH